MQAIKDIDIHNVDCFEYMRGIESNSIPLIVTDPPYGINFSGQTSDTSWDNISDYGNFLVKFLTEAKRILTDNGTLWMCCARTMIPTVFFAIGKVGLRCDLENWLTYARQKGRGSSLKLKSQAEEILHITKSDKWVFNKVEYLREVVAPYVKDGKPRGWFLDQNTGMRVRWSGVGNVLAFTSPTYNSKFEKQIHSTQKPVLLNVELVVLSSNRGDVVLDPFMGSGSCAVACALTGRKFIGCEKDSDMFGKAENWIRHINYSEAEQYVASRIKSKSLF
jgi:site-specific DNA-methyltransferase (adenine-specific)